MYMRKYFALRVVHACYQKISDRFKGIGMQTQCFRVIPFHCILNLKNMKFVIKKIWLKTGWRGNTPNAKSTQILSF